MLSAVDCIADCSVSLTVCRARLPANDEIVESTEYIGQNAGHNNDPPIDDETSQTID